MAPSPAAAPGRVGEAGGGLGAALARQLHVAEAPAAAPAPVDWAALPAPALERVARAAGARGAGALACVAASYRRSLYEAHWVWRELVAEREQGRGESRPGLGWAASVRRGDSFS